MGLAVGMGLKFYHSVAKRSKLKVRKFWGLIPTLVESKGEKLVPGAFFSPILTCAFKIVIKKKENQAKKD